MAITLKELLKDRKKIETEIQLTSQAVLQDNPRLNFLRGIKAYIDDNIKKIKGVEEKKEK